MRRLISGALLAALALASPVSAETFNVEFDATTKDINLVNRRDGGGVEQRWRIGAGGGVAEIVQEGCTGLPAADRHLLAAQVHQETTGRVIQVPVWDRRLCVPGTTGCWEPGTVGEFDGPWNVNQAGDRDNLYAVTHSVAVNADSTQLDIYAVADRQWHPMTMQPYPAGALRGRVGFWSRYTLDPSGVVTIRRVTRLGPLGTRNVNDTAWNTVPWTRPLVQHFIPWQAGAKTKELNATAEAFTSTGAPLGAVYWAADGDTSDIVVPSTYLDPKPVAGSSGYSFAYDTRGVCHGKKRYGAVIYGNKAVVQSDPGLNAQAQRRINPDSAPPDRATTLRVVPEVTMEPSTTALRQAGIVVDSTIKVTIGRDILTARDRLDALAASVPATAVYAPGYAFTGELASIVSTLTDIMAGPLDNARRLDHLYQQPIVSDAPASARRR